jgi:hypothetical protein
MKRPHKEESLRWLTQAKDEFQDADDLRKRDGLPGGVPSRYFDDPQEAEEAMELAMRMIELVEKKVMGTELWKMVR